MAIRIKELKRIHSQAIQLLILHRWDAGRGRGSNGLIRCVAKELGVKADTVKHWRLCGNFRAEFDRQLAIFQRNYDDIQLADRRERVRILDSLFFLVDDSRVELKLKILREIREEVGDNVRRVEQTVTVTQGGVNTPPGASTYEEWLEQNRQMEEAMGEEATGQATEE